MEESKETIKNQILNRIKSGKVEMKPRWHFILRTALLITGAVVVLLVTLYLTSLVLFVLRRTGVLFFPMFGSRGWFEFFVSLPWLLVLAALVFIVILEVLVGHYKFAYRRPLLYSAVGIILFVAAVAFLIDIARFHDRFSRFAEQNSLPLAGDFYHGFRFQRFRNVHRGKVKEIVNGGFVLQNSRGEILNVIEASSTRFPLGMDFSMGDNIVVFGPEESSTIKAYGIRRVDEDFDLDSSSTAMPPSLFFGPPPFLRGNPR